MLFVFVFFVWKLRLEVGMIQPFHGRALCLGLLLVSETEIILFWHLIGCVVHWLILANILEILFCENILTNIVLAHSSYFFFFFWECFFLWSTTMNGIQAPVLHQRGHCYLGLPTIKDECHFWDVSCKNKLRNQAFSWILVKIIMLL